MTKKKEQIKPEPECHAFRFQIDQEESDLEAGKFRGLASVFGSIVDTYPNPTMIEPGAFKKTIADRGNRIKILAHHDQFQMWVGLPTLLEETDQGLLVEASLNNTQRGRDVAEALRHAAAIGKLSTVELSIGFDAMNWELREHDDKQIYRHLNEVKLWEISVVNFGADRQTVVTEAASLHSSEPSPKGTLVEPSPQGTLTSMDLEKYEVELADYQLRYFATQSTGV